MDLLEFRKKYGRPVLKKIAERAGINDNYLSQLLGGFRRISFERAQVLSKLDSELDVVSLQSMADRIKRKKMRARTTKLKGNGKKKPATI